GVHVVARGSFVNSRIHLRIGHASPASLDRGGIRWRTARGNVGFDFLGRGPRLLAGDSGGTHFDPTALFAAVVHIRHGPPGPVLRLGGGRITRRGGFP